MNVEISETLFQIVHVQIDTLKKLIYLVDNVTIGVKDVKLDLIIVNLAQPMLSEKLLILVLVKMVISIVVFGNVTHVMPNVSLVIMLTPVLLVEVIEVQLETVHVLLELILILTGIVNHVLTNV
jgi:hypothetical protein